MPKDRARSRSESSYSCARSGERWAERWWTSVGVDGLGGREMEMSQGEENNKAVEQVQLRC